MLNLKRIIRAVLWRTGLGVKIAKTFWQKVGSGADFKYLYFNSKSVFDGIPVNFDDKELTTYLIQDSARWSRQLEYVLQIKNIIIEPERCIGIKKINKVVAQTTILQQHYPFIFPYLIKRWTAIQIDKAVIYDGYASINYYHFFVNAVNSLHVLKKSPLNSGIPFIVNEVCYKSRFFQYLLENSAEFKSINWLVQKPGDWFKVKTGYRLQGIDFDKSYWLQTLALFNLPQQKSYRKVFLSRDSSQFNRCLTNELEIITMLRKYDFEIIYAEHLSLDEQIKLFRTTRYLVALHGAGLVQQLFMNFEQAHIIEILPRNYLKGLYYWQAYTLDMHYYDIVVGDNLDKNKNYSLDCQKLEHSVTRMLTTTHAGRVYGNFLQK